MAATADEPLTMAVHSMAIPDVRASRNRAGRWKMMLILLVCTAPVIASYVTYYWIRPQGRLNYGELINPQRPLPDIATVSLDGKADKLPALKNQWLLLTVSGAACDKDCEQRLYLQRQLRESLGKDKDRLDRVWLIEDQASVDERLKSALVGAVVLRVPAQSLAKWLPPAPGAHLEDHLYVVDPMGNLMMRFPAGLDAAGAAKAKKDLIRLLRASAGWDKEGR